MVTALAVPEFSLTSWDRDPARNRLLRLIETAHARLTRRDRQRRREQRNLICLAPTRWRDCRGSRCRLPPARDQGKVQQARELLAPVYGWFTEGASRITLRSRSACTNVWYRDQPTAPRADQDLIANRQLHGVEFETTSICRDCPGWAAALGGSGRSDSQKMRARRSTRLNVSMRAICRSLAKWQLTCRALATAM